jgi:hypothetical protein
MEENGVPEENYQPVASQKHSHLKIQKNMRLFVKEMFWMFTIETILAYKLKTC